MRLIMVNYMTMLIVNIFEAKAKLSEYLDLVAGGERVVICKRNRPIAELRAVEAVRAEPRPIGGGTGSFVVPDTFFEPLPDDLLDAFSGGGAASHSRVAESQPDYGAAKKPKGRRGR